MNDKQPLIVMSAPNGARLTKKDCAQLPITPQELAVCAVELLAAGVSVLHLHVRDQFQRHSLKPLLYQQAIDAIKHRVGDELVLQITTEAVGMYDRHQQMAMVRELKPEAVSLALRELCPDDHSIAEASDFFIELAQNGCWAQFILYDSHDVQRFEQMRQANLLGRSDPFALFVLGRYSKALCGNPQELAPLLSIADYQQFPWAVCCFGRTEAQAASKAVNANGHIRLGFENNRMLVDGREAQSNAELIVQTLEQPPITQAQRPLATADWIRQNVIAIKSMGTDNNA